MRTKRLFPFQNMTPTAWQNLALAAMLTFCIMLFGYELAQNNFCRSIGIDYCAYWSGGIISRTRRTADVYDLDILTQTQKEIFPQAQDDSFETFAIMYPPVFVLPFRFLSRLSLPWSYLVWTTLNLVGFIYYLRFFAKETAGLRLPTRLALMCLISLPVFQNLLFGQASIWLLICSGEFLRGIMSGKPLRAGLWLGGWLLKPQLLVLIVPFLLIQRFWKVLFGFMLSSLFVLITSVGLIGVDGLLNLKDTLLDAAAGGVHSKAEFMMNWRMLGINLQTITSPAFGWVVILLGSILTVGVALFFFRKRQAWGSTEHGLALLGVFAATGAVTWHAHLHMSAVLIPPMLYLLLNKKFNQKLFLAWVFLPFAVLFVTFFLTELIDIDRVLFQLLEGSRGFLFNLVFLGWAVAAFRKQTQANEREEGMQPPGEAVA